MTEEAQGTQGLFELRVLEFEVTVYQGGDLADITATVKKQKGINTHWLLLR